VKASVPSVFFSRCVASAKYVDVTAELHVLEGSLEAKLGEIGRLAQEQSSLRRVATRGR